MVYVIKANFSKSNIGELQKLHSSVPQFFSDNYEPYIVANIYMRKLSTRQAPRSLATNAEHVKELLTWMGNSGLEIEEMTDELFGFYVDALCSYKQSSGESLAWNTIEARVSGAFRFLRWATEQGWCRQFNIDEGNQAHLSAKGKFRARAHFSKPIKSPIKFLKLNDALRFVAALGDLSTVQVPGIKLRNQLMGDLMLQTGMRVSEVCEYPLNDLPEIEKRGHSAAARVVGKGNKARVILIPNELLVKLWEYVDIYRMSLAESLSKKGSCSIDNTLFINERGARITSNWMQKLFRRVGAAIKINVNPHMLRHTYGTYHYLLNRDIVTLSKLMGHESVETTERYYVHTAALIAYAGDYNELQLEIDKLSRDSLE